MVAICTRGGNRSWSGIVKRHESGRYDYLFVVVADRRCWFIPADSIDAGSAICLDGPKYSELEIAPPQPMHGSEGT